MRFRTRLILTHSILITIITVCLGLFFRVYMVRQLEASSRANLQRLSENISYQFDQMIWPMQFMSEFLLSDSEIIAAVRTLSNASRVGSDHEYIRSAKNQIQVSLSTYSIETNFYSVNVYNTTGDVIFSNCLRPTKVIPDLNDALPELSAVNRAMGKPVLVPPRSDPWVLESPETVFSLSRLVMGLDQPCYIEVQKRVDTVEKMCSAVVGPNNDVAFFSDNGEVFYSQLTDEQQRWIVDRISQGENGWWRSVPGGAGGLSTAAYSAQTGIFTVVVQSEQVLRNAISAISSTIFIAFLLIAVVSILIVYIATVRLTAPIRRLTRRMNSATLHDIQQGDSIESTNDEIVTLNNTYSLLLQRLNQAAEREKQLESLHLQAEFDALQAQVNPHFLYNILNVLSHRGVINRDNTICEICQNLAAMLRYSTDTARRHSTVGEEVQYVRNYLFLLESRYKDMLNCTIDIDPSIQQETVPKMVLQQIVENCVNHGLSDCVGVMRIEIKGWREADFWKLRVDDNGKGFDNASMMAIQKKLTQFSAAVSDGKSRLGMHMGGLGLVNAYLRMRLICGDAVGFSISNRDAGGASVEISNRMGGRGE